MITRLLNRDPRWSSRFFLLLGATTALSLGGVSAFSQDDAEGSTQPPATPQVAEPAREYMSQAELKIALDEIAAAHPGVVSVTSIGKSREGRDIFAVRIAADGETDPDSRPALLLTAGIDGDHLVGTDVAVEVAKGLADHVTDGEADIRNLLGANTVYIIPRVNPDAAQHYFDKVKLNWRRNARPVDSDRDRAMDEDGPNDLNGDGLITMMRVYEADKADRMIDEDEPRLDLKPDRNKGERAAFYVITEGIDDDGDDAINEDWKGGVDINRNFPHGYEEHSDGAGPYMASEPETLAMLDFVLAHPNIAVALTYGVHDNLSKTPDGKGQHPSSTPKNIHESDVGLYTFIGERFREMTELKSVPGEAAEGAFFDWAYAQFGIPSFTTPLWTRPEAKGEEKENGAPKPAAEEPGEKLTPSGIGDISLETLNELEEAALARGFEVTEEMKAQISPADVEQFAGMMGIKVRRVNQSGGDASAPPASGGGGAKKRGNDANKDEVAWLKYSDDERGGAGFVPWTKVDHPKFGEVEVGGWAPYFKLNPPTSEVKPIAEKQVSFVVDLLGRLPKISFGEAEVNRLAPGLFEIKLPIVNDGYFPTGTAMAVRNRKGRPYVLRIDVPVERIVSGQRVQKYWSIAGSGGREEARWIIQSPDGGSVEAVLYSEKFGEQRHSITLPAGEEVTP